MPWKKMMTIANQKERYGFDASIRREYGACYKSGLHGKLWHSLDCILLIKISEPSHGTQNHSPTWKPPIISLSAYTPLNPFIFPVHCSNGFLLIIWFHFCSRFKRWVQEEYGVFVKEAPYLMVGGVDKDFDSTNMDLVFVFFFFLLIEYNWEQQNGIPIISTWCEWNVLAPYSKSP